MKKSFYLFLAFGITLAYLLFNAYTLTVRYNTSFLEELLFQTPHSLFLHTLFIASFLFFTTLLPLFFKEKKPPVDLEEVRTLETLSNTLFSSLALKFNIIKAQEKLEALLHLEGSLLFIYEKESFSLYNENAFIKTMFRSKDIFPFRTNYERSPVEEIAIRCFIDKSSFTQEHIKVDKKTITLFTFLLKTEEEGRILGSLMLATSDPALIEAHLPLIQKYLLMLTFALSLAFKKEQLQKLDEQYSNENGSFDKLLNVFNYEKLDEHLFYEFKRHKRYHTELTLMLVEINMLENLSKVFPTETITTFKKEFVQLIHKYIREVDIFGKWTQNRFAIIIPDSDFRAAVGLAKKLQGILETTKFAKIGTISCSYGITSLAPKDTLGSLKSRAENALVRATIHQGNAIEVKLQHGVSNDDTLE